MLKRDDENEDSKLGQGNGKGKGKEPAPDRRKRKRRGDYEHGHEPKTTDGEGSSAWSTTKKIKQATGAADDGRGSETGIRGISHSADGMPPVSGRRHFG